MQAKLRDKLESMKDKFKTNNKKQSGVFNYRNL